MHPANFDYHRASSIDEAESLWKENSDASFLAGGHSLIPAMKLRLSDPGTLVDISGIDDLKGISRDGDTIRIGALTTHREVGSSDVVKDGCSALSEAAGMIGDPQVRNRGTIGGNVAHADPASDYPGILMALGATIVTSSRSIVVDDFFTGLFETALNDGEVITEIQVPAIGASSGAAYTKFFNPSSRYAVVGVGALVSKSNGSCSSCRIGVTGAADHAFRASVAEETLQGSDLGDDAVAASAAKVSDGQEMLSDLSASANYRTHLCGVMAKRAIVEAASRA
ncbi:Carbon monoxide dehydrogenase medium chain [hydrothermal vent metagenome]|uniref:Carbon monoxide dehydrogenase medium chain n=1 Tax=hydrothermal vent metagenome TaxID=652676 RepID=A0A161K8R2_9ZZZZ|tara:strand:- start:391 stop:1236 length:846 start_codon:yes stop_codon:yes gene_type:complete